MHASLAGLKSLNLELKEKRSSRSESGARKVEIKGKRSPLSESDTQKA
jgi:hypothetical protein